MGPLCVHARAGVNAFVEQLEGQFEPSNRNALPNKPQELLAATEGPGVPNASGTATRVINGEAGCNRLFERSLHGVALLLQIALLMLIHNVVASPDCERHHCECRILATLRDKAGSVGNE